METTTIASAQSKSNSLRTTIPASIVRQFKLTAGDQLEWELEPRDNQFVLVVRPAKAMDTDRVGEKPKRKTASRGP